MTKTSKPCPLCPNERHITKTGKTSTHCKSCLTRADKAWKSKNPERWAYLQWKAHIKHEFGITPEIFEFMWESQSGKCKICDRGLIKPLTTKKCEETKATIDHDHTTGKVRALLCNPCNVSLGLMKESPKFLRKAAEYLESYGS